MEKGKIILPIGSNKALVFEPDPDNKEDQDFAKLCKEIAATHPQSIQEFFIRLNQLQKGQGAKMQTKNIMTSACNGHATKGTEDYLNNLKTKDHGRTEKKDAQLREQKANKAIRK